MNKLALVIDNYDSFVFNIARYIAELNYPVKVLRNNELTLSDIEKLKPSHIIISPGPCTPNEAGISLDVIKHFGKEIPILGICLGHQAIGQVFGGEVKRAIRPMHGKPSHISHDAKNLFAGIDSPLRVGRYHSLIVCEKNLSKEIVITARCEINEVMAFQHETYPLYGVQFHPESILTEYGHKMMQNFLDIGYLSQAE